MAARRTASIRSGTTPAGFWWLTDQAMVREGFTALLDVQPDIEVVGTAGDWWRA